MNKNNSTKSTAKRAPYGFALTFPTNSAFTLRDLRKQKSYKVQYITVYKRIAAALAKGEIIVAGEKKPAKTQRGRWELTYRRADAKTKIVTVSTPALATPKLADRPF